jgi:uncharacterized protein (DUF488 family)
MDSTSVTQDRFPITEPLILTIGHSTRSIDEFIGLLQAHDIGHLVDVRTIPRSRHNPQFNRETLPESLRGAGIECSHAPELGGLRKSRPDSVNIGWRNLSFRGYADYMQTREFADGLKNLVNLARHGITVIMCAEAVPWRCHRSLIADALTVAGHSVEHIMSVDKTQTHVLTPFARVEGQRITYPGLF